MVDYHLGVTLKGIVYPHLLETVSIVCVQLNLRNESIVLGGIHTGHINTNVVVIRIVELVGGCLTPQQRYGCYMQNSFGSQEWPSLESPCNQKVLLLWCCLEQ
jgi:hypothetical protein